MDTRKVVAKGLIAVCLIDVLSQPKVISSTADRCTYVGSVKCRLFHYGYDTLVAMQYMQVALVTSPGNRVLWQTYTGQNGNFSHVVLGQQCRRTFSPPLKVRLMVEYKFYKLGLGRFVLDTDPLGIVFSEYVSEKTWASSEMIFPRAYLSFQRCVPYHQMTMILEEYTRETAGLPLPYEQLHIRLKTPLAIGAWAWTNVIRLQRLYALIVLTNILRHEFAHTLRHTLDGHWLHLIADAIRYDYLRPHTCSSYTNEGFAFNEGWAEFWSGQCVGWPRYSLGVKYARDDYRLEGNVAEELRRIARLCHHGDQRSKGKKKGRMLAVLRYAGRGAIHSIGDFKRQHRELYPNCNI